MNYERERERKAYRPARRGRDPRAILLEPLQVRVRREYQHGHECHRPDLERPEVQRCDQRRETGWCEGGVCLFP